MTLRYTNSLLTYVPILPLQALLHHVGNLPGHAGALHLEPVAAAVSQGDEERARVCLLPVDFQDILEVIPRHQVLVRKEGGR